MKSIINDNFVFFISIFLLALAGGGYLFIYEKPSLIFFFSNYRNSYADFFFTYFTKLGEAPIYIIAGLVFITYKLRHSILITLLGFTVMGLSFGLKNWFGVDRPIAYLNKQKLLDQVVLVPGVDLHSGASSFPSGHSMSAFAVYTLLILLLPTKKRYVFPLLLTALGVAISRVYLVQHFYNDIYVGSVIGVMVGIAVFALDQKFKLNENHFLENPLVRWRKDKKGKVV